IGVDHMLRVRHRALRHVAAGAAGLLLRLARVAAGAGRVDGYPRAVRIVARAAPETIAHRLFARALLELLGVAGDGHFWVRPAHEDRDRVRQAVSGTIGVPRRARTHHANFAREMALRAYAIAAVGGEFPRVDDIAGQRARNVALGGSVAALASDSRFGERRIGV